MIAFLDLIKIQGEMYATQLIYSSSPSMLKDSTECWFINHPGAEESDHLLAEMDSSFSRPARYNPHTIAKVLIRDCMKGPSRGDLYVPEKEIKWMKGYLASLHKSEGAEIPLVVIAAEEKYTAGEISYARQRAQAIRQRKMEK